MRIVCCLLFVVSLFCCSVVSLFRCFVVSCFLVYETEAWHSCGIKPSSVRHSHTNRRKQDANFSLPRASRSDTDSTRYVSPGDGRSGTVCLSARPSGILAHRTLAELVQLQVFDSDLLHSHCSSCSQNKNISVELISSNHVDYILVQLLMS